MSLLPVGSKRLIVYQLESLLSVQSLASNHFSTQKSWSSQVRKTKLSGNTCYHSSWLNINNTPTKLSFSQSRISPTPSRQSKRSSRMSKIYMNLSSCSTLIPLLAYLFSKCKDSTSKKIVILPCCLKPNANWASNRKNYLKAKLRQKSIMCC